MVSVAKKRESPSSVSCLGNYLAARLVENEKAIEVLQFQWPFYA
ncbi:hypothetical protein VCR15J2_20912 [Vibrio coralliirubri]|uniref:Uncharacterized protein n=1 Tax=Vibrio coralliirubri TaxID=1516159 RepID=A0AA86WNB6_9VIBR|nr:hypothetical protein VCR15J2_20912 [Vibrio coralliirubri]CDT74548.1 hypothetical protein VCR31J2_1310026 [Vibrio coralliirubri]